jgi:hypothetical protein
MCFQIYSAPIHPHCIPIPTLLHTQIHTTHTHIYIYTCICVCVCICICVYIYMCVCVKDIPFICIIEEIFPCSSIVFFQFQHRQVLVAGAGCPEGAEYRPEALVRRRRLGQQTAGEWQLSYIYIFVCLFSCYMYIYIYCILYIVYVCGIRF